MDGFFLISSLNFHFFDGDRWGILWSWSRTRGRHLATLVPGDVARAGAKLLDEVGGVWKKNHSNVQPVGDVWRFADLEIWYEIHVSFLPPFFCVDDSNCSHQVILRSKILRRKLNSHLFKGSSIASSCHAVTLDGHARPCRNNPHRYCQSVRSSWTSSFALELQESLSGRQSWPVDVLTLLLLN